MRVRTRIGLAFVVLLTSACGSSDTSTTAPTTTTPTATAIAVTLSDTVAIGATAQATALATLTNGQTQAIATGFLSDTPSVASVTTGGLVTSVSRGAANIYVVFGGRQGTKAIRVIPNYQGNWSGFYLVTGCNQQGIFATIDGCKQLGVGSLLSLSMVLTQSGETVTGRVSFGTLNSENVSVPMAGDGSLSFLARVPGDPIIDVNMNLATNAANQITGTVFQTWRTVSVFGQMQIAGTISGALVKTSGAPIGSLGVPASGLDQRLRALLGR